MTDLETMLEMFAPDSRAHACTILKRLEPKYGSMSLRTLNELCQHANSAEQRAEIEQYLKAITIYFA